MGKMKVGIAFSSGAAKGIAHVGVIRALEERGIGFDVVAGSSIGAVIGSFYAAGLPIDEIEGFARDFGKKKITHWFDPAFFKGGILKGEKIEEAIREFLGVADFSELRVPFYVAATDLFSGREVVISSGDLVRAVRASCSIPGLFLPVNLDGRWLVDGALVAPLPTRILKSEGCDLIVGVNVSTVPSKQGRLNLAKQPKILDVLMQSLSVTQIKIAEPCLKMADVVIAPDTGHLSWSDFSRTDELISLGYEAAVKSIPLIKRLLERRRGFAFFKRIFCSR